ncbi:SsgA family sporulation/cell division regulator [Geodermatophilus sp. TF02-6]|uniref:SsgA family sporulation/cell division regulator n=1 Tax=Geodermatophilus sp. TF02-6 TaxID=2250575 RepID=UPI000DE813F2|nr:SsgA family sporulation/cell division regulator [Geodermatophilus sp. TF02-6]RBY76706.1 SsgA family sporulation/cell division regulator [Geodermatophilus sp. TF02-6]
MTSSSPPGYTCATTLHLIGPRSWTEVPALLSYEVGDPFAVRIIFGDSGEEDTGISWLVGRELLQAGLDRPTGEGDVRLWPSRTSNDVLFLHLRAPSGEALFEASRGTVAGFLQLTATVVPLGEESSVLDVDDELTTLLSNGGADPSGR